ncbi:glutathione S-transferase 1, isoform D [Caerostris extrusa]|uniref:Glutathione S-transferase 1, isoform D n=1 Tax=Caerostris extrusa TaxID=172846 RepID=A0AAV4XPW2_CAEEX|nr:glutathione S-transferase 1, isoform D [Caerostris extrusa]
MPIDVYLYGASGPCRAVLMVAEQLGIEVNKKTVDLMSGEQMKPEYIGMNPQHCVPTIDDNGFYFVGKANKYAPDSSVYPKDPKERALVDRMLYFDIGTLYKAEGDFLYPQLFRGFLSKTAYAAGDQITLADFSLIASLSFAEAADYSYADYPKITAWMQKLKSEIPSYKEINDVPLQQFKEFLKSKK